MPQPPQPDDQPDDPPGGQTEATKAWVARRDAAARAIEASRVRQDEERARHHRDIEQRQRQGGPMPLIAGIVALLCLLLLALWLFIDRLECDAMWSDRGLSSACKPPPQ